LLIFVCAVLLVVTLGMFLLLYTGLLGVWQATFRTDWHALYNLNVFLARKFNEFKLIMNVVFCHPPGSDFILYWQKTIVTCCSAINLNNVYNTVQQCTPELHFFAFYTFKCWKS
jgi:hypothetical protein